MIELTRASFQYENSDRGVQDISLSVKSGECVVLTGLSGCGKTTVTRLVNGLAPSYYPGAFSGSVRISSLFSRMPHPRRTCRLSLPSRRNDTLAFISYCNL